jgi:hypothetical protein
MASKFTMVDPSQGDDLHHIMAQTVNDRMGKAVEELQEKHDKRAASGKPAEQDDPSVDGPTGSTYRQAEAQERAQQQKSAARSRKAEERAVAAAREEEIVQQLQEANLLSDEEDDDDDDDDENGLDAEFKLIREKRMAQLKAQHQEKAENLSKGHGQYREISQDEFLPEVTGSRHVLVHFYHKDFMRCKIMDKHLAILAPAHLECKFLKINAEKAPFFVGKLQVKILPTVIYFKESIAEERVQGFEGLTEGQPKGMEDEFPTTVLATRLAKLGAIEYTAPPTVEELRRFQLGKTMGAIRAGGGGGCLYDDDEDLDGDISD